MRVHLKKKEGFNELHSKLASDIQDLSDSKLREIVLKFKNGIEWNEDIKTERPKLKECVKSETETEKLKHSETKKARFIQRK